MILRFPKINASLLQRLIFLLTALFFTGMTMAQKTDVDKKISPVLLQQIREGMIKGKTSFRITVIGDRIPKEINRPSFNPEKVFADGRYSVYTITGTVNEILQQILPSAQIIFIESGSRVPKEELLLERLDISANKINLVHRLYPAWNGEGRVVSVKENKPDTQDIDFTGRFLTTNLSSAIINTHATIMATMIAGGGNSWHLGKGAAWGSTISSSDFINLLPDPDAAYRQYNITVQNHSYGVGVESYYGADAAMYDLSALNNKNLIHVFSSGNAGSSAAATGIYAGLPGFANLTGSFKMAKNILTVGATDSFRVVEALSSKGPAHDGRVKPELVAYGEDGSSGAAALVSGTALILQNAYLDLYDTLPSNALIKAVILNSADDVGNNEVDYASGFGSLNARNAVHTIHAGRHFSGTITNGGSKDFSVTVPAGIKKLKLTLVWNDPPALPNAEKALINDLDIILENALTGNTWSPWVLNSFPHPDSLLKPAERKRDSLNNVEQVTLNNPDAGVYLFRINGINVTDQQDFFLAYQFDSTDHFEWQFPTSLDFITAGTQNTIRWNSTRQSNTGILEYSTDKGSSWQKIDDNVDLSVGYFQWNAPAVIDQAILRMSIGASTFSSDTFTISSRTLTDVGFNCPDSLLFFWQKLPGLEYYRVYTLGSRYLDTITVTADSLIVLNKTTYPSLHFAVAPLIDGKEGMRSFTFDYTQQGVECYIRSFLGKLDNNKAILTLSLGTLYGIDAIVLEKYAAGRYLPFETINWPGNLQINFTDNKLANGLNIYRAKLELAGGRIIYSQPETVYSFSGNSFIIFPNPVAQGQPLEILTNSKIISDITLIVYDSYGRKIIQKTLNNFQEKLPTDKLPKGLYFFRLIVEGEKDTIMRVIVL